MTWSWFQSWPDLSWWANELDPTSQGGKQQPSFHPTSSEQFKLHNIYHLQTWSLQLIRWQSLKISNKRKVSTNFWVNKDLKQVYSKSMHDQLAFSFARWLKFETTSLLQVLRWFWDFWPSNCCIWKNWNVVQIRRNLLFCGLKFQRQSGRSDPLKGNVNSKQNNASLTASEHRKQLTNDVAVIK